MKKLIALTLAATLGSGAALADDWPSRTVTVTVGFGPGSTPDLMARLIAENLQERLGQPFVVDNRPGAGGNIALDAVAQADPDGYTLGVTIPGPLIVNPMRMELMYDPSTDIRPVTILGTQPSVLMVSTELGVSTLPELIALLQENPGEFNYSSIGVGSISHLAMEMIALESGTEIEHIPYTSSPEAVQAVVNGEVQMAAMPPLAVLPQAEEGNVVMIAQTAAERMPVVADVPTFAEEGLTGVQAEAWMALAATGGTPDAVIERLYAEVRAILDMPEVQERLAGWGMAPVGMPPAEFEARIAEETTRWQAVVDAAGLAR
ncbi:MAG: tripartite tricarboxylate transporter substrate binding protein [Pararhodobacter sp.]|nr:tripartite tricarboxylate transporter substrate binding protein [Pararhodobacter sp.]